MDIFVKQPADVLDYGVNLTKWLVTGDTVTGATATVSPSGLTVAVTGPTTTEPTVWASSGADGTTYQITLTVVTAGGRTKEFEFQIKVTEI